MSKKNNLEFKLANYLNDKTYDDWLYKLKRIATSMFVWNNLPPTMDSRFLEKCLFLHGQACFLHDNDIGFINLNVSSAGELNIYEIPTSVSCYSTEYETTRTVYPYIDKNDTNDENQNKAILVMNNWDRIPTLSSIELFAYRLYNCDRTIDINLNAQKTPLIISGDKKELLTLKNYYKNYEGNIPFTFMDKNSSLENSIQAINTNSPYVVDKIQEQKQNIINEFLQFLGINTIPIYKKERSITNEIDANNEVTNYNLHSMLDPRQKACEQFNNYFNLDDKQKISVSINSDLSNVIKKELGFNE